MATKKVLLTKAKTNTQTLQQVADDVVAKVSGASISKILTSQACIIIDADNTKNQEELYTEVVALDHGRVQKDHSNFEFHATRGTYEPGSTTDRYWHLDALTRFDYTHNATSGLGTYSSTNNGDEVDIYIMDSGIRGASRPTGVGANLHPELFDPDNKANLNGTSEQGDYRVYELPTSLYASGATGNSNEPQDTGNVGKDGHGTSCAICAAGINAGVANKAKIYSLRISDDSGTIYLSKMREAYDAIYRHNDPEDSAFKGKTLDGNTRARSAVVNVSIGQTNPNPKSPYVDRNERYTGQNYSFTVTAADNSNYTITGTDANGAVSGSDPTITCKKGDTLTFTMNAAGHPFHIQSDYNNTTSYDVSKAVSGSSGAGTETGGDVFWDTNTGLLGKSNGLYRYICQNHSAMTGQIVVGDAQPLSSSGENGLDEGEFKVATLNGVTLCRSAGNGLDFFDPDLNADVDYGPLNTKVDYGSRSAGQDSKLDPEITFTDGYARRGDEYGNGEADSADVLTVGALRVGTNNKLTFASFTNYGEAVTIYAPGQALNIPRYDWNSNTVTATDYSNGTHDSISGTSFSSPIVAGMAAIWRQVHDRAGEPAMNCAKWVERRWEFGDTSSDSQAGIDYTGIGGWLNNTNTSEGAATTRIMTTNSVDTHYRFSTSSGSNNILFKLTPTEYTELSPQVNDIYEFEFPRVEEAPNAPDATTLLRNQRENYTFNLGERRDYKVTVTNPGSGHVFTFDRIINGSPANNPIAGQGLELDNGVVWRFDQTDVTNQTHPLGFSNTADGTHSGGKDFTNLVDQDIGNGTHGYRMNLKYYADQGSGVEEVTKAQYDGIVGSGVTCYIEWINPMGETHPSVSSGALPAYPTAWFYYCVNHPSMGNSIVQTSTGAGFGSTTKAMVGGIDLEVFSSTWRKVTAVDSVNKTITFQADSNATGSESGGGGGFNNGIGGAEYGTGDKPRWPMRFTKITGTFYANDAFWNWTQNFSNVVSNTAKYAGGAHIAGEFWAQLEAEEGNSDGKPVKYFPIPKSRFTKESINNQFNNVADNIYPVSTIYNSGPRWGRGFHDNMQHIFVPIEGGEKQTYDAQVAFQPFIDLQVSWTTAGGNIGTWGNTDSVNKDLSVSAVTTFANETVSSGITKIYELVSGGSRSAFTESGGNYTITGSGVTLNGTTGVLSGTASSDAADTTYTLRVREKVSDQYADYEFTLIGTGSSSSTITITGQPSAGAGDGSYPVDNGTVVYNITATDSASTALTYQWQYATSSVQANLGNWINITATGGFTGSTGMQTATLNVADNLLLDDYYFSCVVNSATAAASVRSNAVLLDISVSISSTVAWNNQAWDEETTVWAGSNCAAAAANCTQSNVEATWASTDGATLTAEPIYSATLTGNESNIVSKVVDSNNYCLQEISASGGAGNKVYRLRVGKGTDGQGNTCDDSNQKIKLKFTHPTISGFSATTNTEVGPFTVQTSYGFATNLGGTGSVQSGTNHTFTVVANKLTGTDVVPDATTIWLYQLSGTTTWTKVDGTESWFASRDDATTNTSGLTVTSTTALDQSKWKAVVYADNASSGVTDTKGIALYSGVESAVQVLTVTAAPTIVMERPSGVTADNSISITQGTLSTSEHLLTIDSDGLPDPAVHGADFTGTDAIQVITRQHKIIWRGGTNTPSLTPWTAGPLGVFANGVSLRYPSAGTDTVPNANQSPPAGWEFNEVHFADLWNADAASGFTEGNGEYHYQTSAFLSAWAGASWQGIADSNGYYKNTNFNGNNFQHTDGHSKIVGIAYDGYPIYGPWGYTTYNDNTSAVKRVTTSFAKATVDTARPAGFKFTDQLTFSDSTPNQTLVSGSFIQDYSYAPGSGDLDQSNGRYCVTPDFPNGTYAYFMCQDNSGNPVFPYVVGTALRQAYYLPGTNASDPGGTNSQGPGQGGFDITKIFAKGMTMVAETGGNNTREITGDSAGMTFGTAPYTYNWQKSTDGGSTWTNIVSANDPGFFNENNATLSVYDTHIGIDNLVVRLKVTDNTNVFKVSEALPIQFIGSTLSISSQPADVSILSGQAATFSVTAASTDDVTLLYQWQESQDNGTTWTDIAGDTTASCTRSGDSTAVSANQYEYRCKITSTSATNSPLYSSAAVLTVSQGTITISNQPNATAVNEGVDAQFGVTVTTNSGLPILYKWQDSPDGSTWTDIASGGTSATLTRTAVDYATYNGKQYRVIASIAGLGSVTSDPAALTVYRTINIGTHPADVSIYATQNATFTVAATVSSGTATYQWQESTDGTTYTDIGSATTNTYTITSATTAQDGYKYRDIVDVTGSNGAITSNVATLSVAVQPTLSITNHPGSASIYQPDTHSFNVSASASDSSTITYQWQKSDDNGTSWQDVAAATNNGYTTPATVTATDNGDQYRVVISHPAATNSPLTSNAAVLTVVTPVIQISSQPVSVQTTAGVPTTFAVSATVTSGKNITYQWQVSSDNGTSWADIANAIADNYSVTGSATNSGYKFRCNLDSLGASQVASQAATLTLTFIAQPTIQTSHIDTGTNKTFVRQPKIQASLFVSYLGNGHDASFWKIIKLSDNSTVYDTAVDVGAGGDTTNKVELTTPVLDWNEQYQITVKYKDGAGFISAESPAVSFTTPVADQPVFSLPIPTSLRPTITLNTVSYDTVNYNHTSTDWQIADDAQFSNVIYESLNDTTNKTELEVPSTVVLQSSTNYYVRSRINVT